MDAQQLIDSWKERQRQIFMTLPEPLRSEYERLEDAIALAEAALGRTTEQAGTKDRPKEQRSQPTLYDPAVTSAQIVNQRRQRVSLTVRKNDLIRFLRGHGAATRGEILAATGIPNGSLGNLLNEPEFVNENGAWKVKE